MNAITELIKKLEGVVSQPSEESDAACGNTLRQTETYDVYTKRDVTDNATKCNALRAIIWDVRNARPIDDPSLQLERARYLQCVNHMHIAPLTSGTRKMVLEGVSNPIAASCVLHLLGQRGISTRELRAVADVMNMSQTINNPRVRYELANLGLEVVCRKFQHVRSNGKIAYAGLWFCRYVSANDANQNQLLAMS